MLADKQESLLQNDTMTFMRMVKNSQNSHVSSLQYFTLYQKRSLWWSWFQNFGSQSFLQADTVINDGHDQAFSKLEWSSYFAWK